MSLTEEEEIFMSHIDELINEDRVDVQGVVVSVLFQKNDSKYTSFMCNTHTEHIKEVEEQLSRQIEKKEGTTNRVNYIR